MKRSRATANEPDLISALGHAGILIHGYHVAVLENILGAAQKLPKDADLTRDGLLCCGAIKHPRMEEKFNFNHSRTCIQV